MTGMDMGRPMFTAREVKDLAWRHGWDRMKSNAIDHGRLIIFISERCKGVRMTIYLKTGAVSIRQGKTKILRRNVKTKAQLGSLMAHPLTPTSSSTGHYTRMKKFGKDSSNGHQKDDKNIVQRKGLSSDYLPRVSIKKKILEATRELLEALAMLDEVDRRDYSLILADGPSWITVRELLAEVKILVKKKEEDKKQYLKHLDIGYSQ